MEYCGMNDYRNYLRHYGVLGMKWGRRKQRPTSSNPRHRKIQNKKSIGQLMINSAKKKASQVRYDYRDVKNGAKSGVRDWTQDAAMTAALGVSMYGVKTYLAGTTMGMSKKVAVQRALAQSGVMALKSAKVIPAAAVTGVAIGTAVGATSQLYDKHKDKE